LEYVLFQGYRNMNSNPLIGYWDAVAIATSVCLPNLMWIVCASRRAWRGADIFLGSLKTIPVLHLSVFTVAKWLFLYNLFSDYFDLVMPHWLWVSPINAYSDAPQAAAFWATIMLLPVISWIIYKDLKNWHLPETNRERINWRR
jgi:hypothetical protein